MVYKDIDISWCDWQAFVKMWSFLTISTTLIHITTPPNEKPDWVTVTEDRTVEQAEFLSSWALHTYDSHDSYSTYMA